MPLVSAYISDQEQSQTCLRHVGQFQVCILFPSKNYGDWQKKPTKIKSSKPGQPKQEITLKLQILGQVTYIISKENGLRHGKK